MDTGQLLALQTQNLTRRRLDVAANNLANANTTGFKSDAIVFAEARDTRAKAEGRPGDIRFVRDVGVVRDMAQGALQRTGAPLDLAIEGGGFFAVRGPDGAVLYTRDGGFRLNPDNQLVTRDGYPVLDIGGAPIAIDARGQTLSVGRRGEITVGDAELGQLQLAGFASPGRLDKVGDNLFAAAGQAPVAAEGVVVQGALEGSNVRPVIELTQIIDITRAYESASRIVRQHDELRQTAIQRLSRA